MKKSAHKFVIAAQGTGKEMTYDGEKFSERTPRRFSSATAAAKLGRGLLARFPVLSKYRVSVRSVGQPIRGRAKKAGSAGLAKSAKHCDAKLQQAAAPLKSRKQNPGKARSIKLRGHGYYIADNKPYGPVEESLHSSEAHAERHSKKLDAFLRKSSKGKIGFRRTNPSLRDPELQRAAALLEEFSGHKPTEVLRVSEKPMRKGLVIGQLDGVLYTTVRDGKVEAYVHKFRKKSRPLLTASADGTQIGIVGGRFQMTEAGIEDR